MAFDGLDFKWTAEVYGTNSPHMDQEHQGEGYPFITIYDIYDIYESSSADKDTH